MKPEAIYPKKLESMKRPFFAGVCALLLAQSAFAYINDQVVVYPGFGDASAIQIDDVNFVNNNVFSVTLPTFSALPGSLYETTDTLNYTNRGYMFGFPGFKFVYNPAVPLPP